MASLATSLIMLIKKDPHAVKELKYQLTKLYPRAGSKEIALTEAAINPQQFREASRFVLKGNSK